MSNEPLSKTPTDGGIKLPPWLILAVIVAILGFSWWQNSHTSQSKSLIGIHQEQEYKTEQRDGFAEVLPNADLPTRSKTQNDQSATVYGSQELNGADVPPPPEPGVGTQPKSETSSPVPSSMRAQNEKRLNDLRTDPEPPTDRQRSNGPLSNFRANPSKANEADTAKPTVAVRQRPASKSETGEKADADTFQIKNQTIRDLDGRVVYKGTINLKPTLDRIARGEANRHRNDGTIFQNRENRLPRKPAGYYTEYVNPTPGENGPGPQRIIIGKNDEVWYTPDHYKTFKQIK